jgi:MFS transporter, FHS family, Na+ dependent glucose transporter 1
LTLSKKKNDVSQTIAYFAAFVALGLTVGALGPTLPSLAQQTHVGLSAISYLFTARSLGYVLGATRSGKLFDTKPGNPLMALILIAMSLMMALVPLAHTLLLLLLVMLLLGVAEAGLDIGANTLLVWLHGDRVAPFMNAMHSSFGVGALVAPVIVAQTAGLGYPLTHSYFFLALLLLPVSGYMALLPRAIAPAITKDHAKVVTNSRLVFLIALFLFLYVGAEVSFAGWIFTYTVELKLSSTTTAAYLTSLFWGSLTIGRMLTIPLATRFKAQAILFGSLAGGLLCLILMLGISHSFATLLVATIGLGLSMASIFPTTFSFAGRHLAISGKVTGWFVFGSSAGAMLIPLLIGQAFKPFGPSIVMIVTGSMLVLAIGVLFLVSRNALLPEARNSVMSSQ